MAAMSVCNVSAAIPDCCLNCLSGVALEIIGDDIVTLSELLGNDDLRGARKLQLAKFPSARSSVRRRFLTGRVGGWLTIAVSSGRTAGGKRN